MKKLILAFEFKSSISNELLREALNRNIVNNFYDIIKII